MSFHRKPSAALSSARHDKEFEVAF